MIFIYISHNQLKTSVILRKCFKKIVFFSANSRVLKAQNLKLINLIEIHFEMYENVSKILKIFLHYLLATEIIEKVLFFVKFKSKNLIKKKCTT